MVDYPAFLIGVVVAFAVFGLALAYVDRIASRRPDPDASPAE
jgi:hypothetical protein